MIEIQIEQAKDYSAVESLVQNAFVDVEFSDHQEHLLVKRLRKSAAFIPELALVAKIEDEIVGYILYSKIKIINDNQEYKVLAVAPLAVLPKKQKQGIGSALMHYSIEYAKTKLDYPAIIILGHPEYYQKFGFVAASKYAISAPFEVPDEAFMVLELTDGSLRQISGVVNYPQEFWEGE